MIYRLSEWKRRFFSIIVVIFCVSNCIWQAAAQGSANAFVRDGAIDPTFSALPAVAGSGTVNAVLRLPDGKILIGGNIPSIAGTITKDVVRLNSDGTPDLSFNTGTGSDGTVRRLHLQADGKILVSGQFSVFNGVSRSSIVRLNPDGSVDTSFGVTITANSSSPQALVCNIQPDGKIIIGGDFTSVNGVQRRQVARLNPSGSVDASFDFGNTPSGYVHAVRLLAFDGKMLVGRNAVTGAGVIRLNSDGSLDTAFALNLNVSAYDLHLLPGNQFLVAGSSQFGSGVLRFNGDGSLDVNFNYANSFQDGDVLSVMTQPDGKIIAVGSFRTVTVGGVTRASAGIARLNSDGSFDTSFASPVEGSATFRDVRAALLESDGKIVIGGTFERLQTAPTSALARINGDGSLDSSFQGRILRRGWVYSQYIFPDGKILVGGSFNMLNLAARQFVGRLNSDGDVDNSFVSSSSPGGPVRKVARQPDGKFLAGGITTDFGDKALWRVNADGSLDSGFNVTFNTNASILAIVVQPDGKILIGGSFNTVNGVARSSFARLNPDGSLDSFSVSFGTGGSVNGIILQPDGKIIIGGGFFEVNATPGTARIARLNPDGSVDASYTPNAGGSYSSMNGLHQLNGKIFVAGRFAGSANGDRSPLVKLNENGTADYSFNAGNIVGDVNSVAQLPSGKIVIGGDFNSFGESGNRRYLVRLLENGSLDYTFDAGSFTSLPNTPPLMVNQVGVTPDNKVLVSGSFDQIAGQTRWSMARFKSDACVTRTVADFDGDGKTDVSVFRPANGVWYRVNSSSNGFRTYQFGLPTDKLVSADYDGDGRTDIAVFRPSNGTWYIINSGNGSFHFEHFGADGDLPYPADFDGDGRTDLAVFRPSSGTWYLQRSREGFTGIQFGQQNDLPVAGDYDGDCKADIAIFRPSTGQWWHLRSSNGQAVSSTFGTSTDRPVPADYTGDGKTDVAVWRPSEGVWYVLRSEDYSFFAVPFGLADDVPVPGDYDGDGRADAAVFRPTNSTWYFQRSTTGFAAFRFGNATDKPIPGALIP